MISANLFHGVLLQDAGTMGNVIEGNRIGTDVTGTANLGNTGDGVNIVSSPNNTIGGTAAGAGNSIAFNTAAGVFVSTATGNQILGNQIFSNGNLGINSTAGTLGNFPTLTSAVSTQGTVVTGTVTATVAGSYRIELFANPTADPSGFGQGQQFLGATTVTAAGPGALGFQATLPSTLTSGESVSATTTGPDNTTSQFARDIQVVTPGVFTLSPASASAVGWRQRELHRHALERQRWHGRIHLCDQRRNRSRRH